VGAPAPLGWRKNFLPMIYRENLYVNPQAEQESIFRTFFVGRVDLEMGVVHLVALEVFVEGED